jgi:hypothetical protein
MRCGAGREYFNTAGAAYRRQYSKVSCWTEASVNCLTKNRGQEEIIPLFYFDYYTMHRPGNLTGKTGSKSGTAGAT